MLAVAGCSIGIDTLGGREKCWPEGERRAPSLMRGILGIDAASARLDTPEGEVIPLGSGALGSRGESLALMGGSGVVAKADDDVILFGGAAPMGSSSCARSRRTAARRSPINQDTGQEPSRARRGEA